MNRYLILLLLIISSCGKQSDPNAKKLSFYHWKSDFSFSSADSLLLEQTGTDRLYVRFFDLDHDEWSYRTLAPVSRLKQKHHFPKGIEIIPVIYIDNEALADCDPVEIPEMARKTWAKVKRMHDRHCSLPLKEIQFDCDWNESTRGSFFSFLEHFRTYSKSVRLSSTIRLYQYKYPEKTGVPPVDAGVLMYYNMSDLHELETPNYILDPDEGEKYLKHASTYPLQMDVALPIYKQGVEYYSYGSIAGLIRGEEVDRMIKKGILTHEKGNFYRISNNLTPEDHGDEIRVGNIVRYEEVSPELLLKSASRLAGHFPDARVIFFDLQEYHYSNYHPNTFTDVQALFN